MTIIKVTLNHYVSVLNERDRAKKLIAQFVDEHKSLLIKSGDRST